MSSMWYAKGRRGGGDHGDRTMGIIGGGGQRAMGYGALPGRAMCVVCGIGAAAEELHHLQMEILPK